jgi:hypothetical protein
VCDEKRFQPLFRALTIALRTKPAQAISRPETILETFLAQAIPTKYTV